MRPSRSRCAGGRFERMIALWMGFGSRVLVGLLALVAVGCTDDPAGLLDEVAVAEVVLSADTLLIPALGFERQLEVAVVDARGEPVPGAPVVWGSRNPSRVQVDAQGLVLGREYGDALVIASVGEVSDTVVVRVAQVPASMVIEGPDTLWAATARAHLAAVMVDSAGRAIGDAPEWTSSNPGIMVVEGVYDTTVAGVYAQGVQGGAVITAELWGVMTQKEVTVRQRPAWISLSSNRLNLIVGDTMTLRAEVRDEADQTIVGEPIEFWSSDTTVATISQAGLMTVVGGGTALVGARSGALSNHGPFSIPHATPPPGTLVVTPTTHQSDGFGEVIRVEAFADNGVDPPVSVPASWTSRDPSVATVSQYFARTEGNGSTWLVAEYDGRADSIFVEVQRVPVELSFQGLPQEVAITFTSGAGVYPITLDRFGGIAQDWVQTYWTIRDSTVVGVGPSGLRAIRGGSSWVIAELEGLSDSLHVTVIPQWGGDYTVTTQADLDYFAELGIEEVAYGDLRIDGTLVSSLDGLETLTSVRGSLRIENNLALRDMGALRNLEIVQQSVVIQTNERLLVGLPILESVGTLVVRGNAAVDVGAFASLREATDSGDPWYQALVIGENGTARIEFPSLERVGSEIAVMGSQELEAFSAPALWRAGSVTFRDNYSLTTIELGSLTTIAVNLAVIGNTSLTSLSGLSQLTSGVRRLYLSNNRALTTLDGLRRMGDALGSDPIVYQECEIVGNTGLTSPVSDFLNVLEDKFPGSGVSACR